MRLIARQAAGSVRDALSLLDQAIAYVAPEPLTAEVTADVLGVADRRLLVELAGAALDRDAGTALRLVARGRRSRRRLRRARARRSWGSCATWR